VAGTESEKSISGVVMVKEREAVKISIGGINQYQSVLWSGRTVPKYAHHLWVWKGGGGGWRWKEASIISISNDNSSNQRSCEENQRHGVAAIGMPSRYGDNLKYRMTKAKYKRVKASKWRSVTSAS